MPARDADTRRNQVVAAIKAPTPGALRTLTTALDDADPLVREWAIEGLIRRKDRGNAVSSLLRRLRDERADVRWYAARALGKLGVSEKPVQDALLKAVDDSDEYVRCFAAWALGNLQVREAIPCLQELSLPKTSSAAESLTISARLP
jgi:HEAT repeat protein